MPEEIPDWVDEMPDNYALIMFASGSDVQNIELTREEFIELKGHLAALRGYGLGTARQAVADMLATDDFDERYTSRDPVDVATNLSLAREAYSQWPRLVISRSEEFDAELLRLQRERH